jgi:hypothetical protein
MSKPSCRRFSDQGQALTAFRTAAAKFGRALRQAKVWAEAGSTRKARDHQLKADRALKNADVALMCAGELFTDVGYDRQGRIYRRYEDGLEQMQNKYKRVVKTLY